MSQLSHIKVKYILNANIVFEMFRNNLVMLDVGNRKSFLKMPFGSFKRASVSLQWLNHVILKSTCFSDRIPVSAAHCSENFAHLLVWPDSKASIQVWYRVKRTQKDTVLVLVHQKRLSAITNLWDAGLCSVWLEAECRLRATRLWETEWAQSYWPEDTKSLQR